MGLEGQELVDWMSDAERHWRERLAPVNLVIESDFSEDEVREAQRNYGAAATSMFRSGYACTDVIKRFPAITLITLVGHAAVSYNQGAYWDEYWAQLGRYRDPDFETALRRHLTCLLDRFNLARFPLLENRNQYVMTFAMHSGIPAHCLADLVLMVDDHLVQGREMTGAVLMQWLDEPGKEYRVRNLDVPVRNFLQFGGEFAVDILDRIMEMVDATGTDPTLLDSGLDSSTTGLPTVLTTELVNQLREKPVRWRGRRSSRGVVERRPTLVYSLTDDQIAVTIPYPRSSPELPWRISLDGQVREVFAKRGWGLAGEAPAPTTMPLPNPLREILMWHDGRDSSVSLRVVDKADPLLTFSEDGAWIPRRDGLKDAVWAVYPHDCELVDPTSATLVDVSGDSGNPEGWRGWRSSLIELTKVNAVQLRCGTELIGTPRTVRKDARPTFRFVDPLVGVKTLDGRSVYAQRPWVMLPSSADVSTRWRVRTRRLGDTAWLANETWDAEGEETCVDPFDDDEHPQLGLFEVLVSGPLGADARAVFFLAQGLWLEFDADLRAPAARGFASCVTSIGADTNLIVSNDRLEFSRDELEKSITVDSPNTDSTVELVIHPPHVETRGGLVGSPASWRFTPDVWEPKILSEDRFIAIRAPGAQSVHFTFVDASGQPLQTEREPSRKPGGAFQLPTQPFADTVRRAAIGRIVAHVSTPAETVEVTVLALRPQNLSAGVRIRGDLLQFDGLLDASDLATYVWCTTAPWRPVQILPIANNTAQLPDDLIGAGDLVCRVFVDDPWVAIDPPERLDANDLRATQSGWCRAGSTAQSNLSRFIAGEGPAPEGAGAMPEIWPGISLLESDAAIGARQPAVAGLVRLLAEAPRDSFEGLGNSTIPLTDKMAILIRTELVNRSYASLETLNELHADPWFGCMVEIADLPSLHRRREEVADEREATLTYLAEKGGDFLLEVLRTGKTIRMQEGCFDRSVFMMDGMQPDQVEGILLGLQLVPGPLLHPDTRVAASVDAFRRRSDWMRSGWSENFSAQVSYVVDPIRRASRAAYDVIAGRNESLDGIDVYQHPWMLMSLQSITLALLARLEAHGRIPGQYLNSGLLTSWAKLAALCPRMVATDILIAEAVVTHDRRGDLVGDVK